MFVTIEKSFLKVNFLLFFSTSSSFVPLYPETKLTSFSLIGYVLFYRFVYESRSYLHDEYLHQGVENRHCRVVVDLIVIILLGCYTRSSYNFVEHHRSE